MGLDDRIGRRRFDHHHGLHRVFLLGSIRRRLTVCQECARPGTARVPHRAEAGEDTRSIRVWGTVGNKTDIVLEWPPATMVTRTYATRRLRMTSLNEALASRQRVAGVSGLSVLPPSTGQCLTARAVASIRLSSNASLVRGFTKLHGNISRRCVDVGSDLEVII